MNPSSYSDELDAERARNEAYLRRCREQATSLVPFEGPANTIWGGATPNVGKQVRGLLIGRVALDSRCTELHDFYVAPGHMDDSVLFVSWAAPLAGLLFDGRGWDPARVPDRRSAPNPQALLARRTFAARGNNVTAFTDDLEAGTERSSVFRRDAEPPTIPPPPAAAPGAPATWEEAPPTPPSTTADPSEPEDEEPQDESDASGMDKDLQGSTTAPTGTPRPPDRLERADDSSGRRSRGLGTPDFTRYCEPSSRISIDSSHGPLGSILPSKGTRGPARRSWPCIGRRSSRMPATPTA